MTGVRQKERMLREIKWTSRAIRYRLTNGRTDPNYRQSTPFKLNLKTNKLKTIH